MHFAGMPGDELMKDEDLERDTAKLAVRRNFYVYAHRDSTGAIFYIGKGTGERAWSRDRHPVWHRYVQDHLSGNYIVDILEEALSETEAEERESALIDRFGTQLVNWQNSGRDFDYAALEKYHAMRGANLLFVAATRPLETANIQLAIDRYRQALDHLRAYESLVLERGLVAELSNQPKVGDPNILDRLTLCLMLVGRSLDARVETDRYLEEFPGARTTGIGKRILRRVMSNRALNDVRAIAGVPSGAVANDDSPHKVSKVGKRIREQTKPRYLDRPVPKDPVERNIQGRELERAGFIENAIEFYQANLRDGFEGNYPYDRLAVIFRQRGDLAAEILVLKRAMQVFGALQGTFRADVAPKLARFAARLSGAQRLAEKRGQAQQS
jgi:hypothetical protein